jgi:hypothetical protein
VAIRPARRARLHCASGCLCGFGMPKDALHPAKIHQTTHSRRQLAAEYFERYPKDRYQTEIENWRHLQSDNIEFTIKRLREPIDADNHGG